MLATSPRRLSGGCGGRESLYIRFAPDDSPDGYERKLADERALIIEAAELLRDGGDRIRDGLGDARVKELERVRLPFPEPVAPDAAERRFLEAHAKAERQVHEASGT